MMEQHEQETGSVTPEAPAVSLGDTLRQAREQRGLSVEDISNQIKFAPRQIEALEANDFGPMTDAAFLRGFVRSYARLLHLDVEAVLALLPHTKVAVLTAAPEPHRMAFPNVQTTRRQQNLIWMSGALLVIVIALGFAISNLKFSERSASQESAEAPVAVPNVPEPQAASAVPQAEPVAAPVTTAPVVAVVPIVEPPAVKQKTETVEKPVAARPQPKPVAVAPPAPAAKPIEAPSPAPAAPVAVELPAKKPIPIDMLLGLNTPPAKPEATQAEPPAPAQPAPAATLRIVFGEESWAEIKDKNGKVLSSQIHRAGSELNLNVGHAAPYDLAIGHAKTARLYYKGKQIDLNPYVKKYSAVAHVTLE